MITELGRLTYDVEVKAVGSDQKVLNNGIAIQRSKNETVFVDIVAWNGVAEMIGKHFKKGYEIMVTGSLVNRIRKKNEVEYQTVAIKVEKITFTNGNPKKNEGEVKDFL